MEKCWFGTHGGSGQQVLLQSPSKNTLTLTAQLPPNGAGHQRGAGLVFCQPRKEQQNQEAPLFLCQKKKLNPDPNGPWRSCGVSDRSTLVLTRGLNQLKCRQCNQCFYILDGVVSYLCCQSTYFYILDTMGTRGLSENSHVFVFKSQINAHAGIHMHRRHCRQRWVNG